MSNFHVARMQRWATILRIKSTELEVALTLAECLRCVELGLARQLRGFEPYAAQPYPPELKEFAEEIGEDRVVIGRTGARTGKPFNTQELLLLCALYSIVTFATDSVRLFKRLSKRSTEAVRDKFNSMVKDFSGPGRV